MRKILVSLIAVLMVLAMVVPASFVSKAATEGVTVYTPTDLSYEVEYCSGYAYIDIQWSGTDATFSSDLDDYITLSYWEYQVSTTSGVWTDLYDDGTNDEKCADIKASYGSVYYIRVRQVALVTETWYDYYYGTVDYTYSEFTDVITVELGQTAPTLTEAESASATSVTLTWDIMEDELGIYDSGYVETYAIYRSTSENGTYTCVGTAEYEWDDDYWWNYFWGVATTLDTTMTYTDTGLTMGNTYYYKICACDENGNVISGFSNIVSVTAVPGKVTLTVTVASISSLTLKWTQGETCVTGYIIYQGDSATGDFTAVKNITNRTTVKCTITGLTIGKEYFYRIVPYVKNGSNITYGVASSLQSGTPSVLAPKIKKVKVTAIKKAKISWKKVKNASGYIIYRSTSKDGTYKKVGTVKKNKLSYTVKGLKNGTTYYYKVQAYKTVKGVKYKGVMSSVKKKIQDKLSYETESYTSKCKRAFGKKYYVYYSSATKAKSKMKTISVKVWDFDSSGKKVTKTKWITVNKGVAETVKQIFKEIYNGKEKFPIHELGGYSWRGSGSSSQHNQGLAIDINPNENAQFSSDGTVLVGSYYKPGVDPYSISADSEVVAIFAKYGWGWGNWYSKPDYMHFSYFGT